MINDPNYNRKLVLMKCTGLEDTSDQIAWESVWHFFIGNDPDFENLYERRMVQTHKEQDEIYIMCSEILFEQEMYVANLLDEGDTKELLWVIKDLGSKIKDILEEE